MFPKKVEIIPIRMPLVEAGVDVAQQIVKSVIEAGTKLEDGDIVAVADKILATAEGRTINYTKVEASQKARELAREFNLEPGFVELVLREAEHVYGGVQRALLTLKHGVLVANAGIDHKNAPVNHACLWPENPHAAAKALKDSLQRLTGKRLGVLLVDSHVTPLRMGTTGFALGLAGFEPVKDCRGALDLYGKPLLITRMNIADDLASAAHLVMGETDERVPVAILRGAPVEVVDEGDPKSLYIPVSEDLYMTVFRSREKSTI
ncbi:MAG: coenzyme F420-0:L-glutamate ligase [Candidatus Bathyarchaeia archaeon]